jgi:hypothetical protein
MMLADPATGSIVQCSNPVCKVAEKHTCVEGLALDVCPHYGKAPEPKAVSGSATAEPHGMRLPLGDLLAIAEASGVLRRGGSRVIAFVGPKEAGKTTLIASIFELFLRGEIGPYQFSSSMSLYAFERSCHPSRAASQNVIPKTERTLSTDVLFYHLATRKADAPAVDILLADRNGEDYSASADDPSTASGFVEIARADTITFLVDGSRLLDLAARTSVVSEIVAIAQALIDGGAINERPHVAVVLTKLDDINRSADRNRPIRDFQNLVTRIRSLYGGIFGEIRSFEVAACPSDMSLPLGHGVLELLDYWLAKAPVPFLADLPYATRSMRLMHLLRGTQE